MQTRVMDIVLAIIEKIEHLPEENSNNLFVRLESKITFEKLKLNLQKLRFCTLTANEKNLEMILTFLAKRWAAIYSKEKLTDSIFFYSPDSKANLALFIVADEIAKVLHLPITSLLMPTINSQTLTITEGNFRGFIFSDEGEVINVAECLRNNIDEKGEGILRFSQRILSYEEIMRVVMYAEESKEFYFAKRKSLPNSHEYYQKLMNAIANKTLKPKLGHNKFSNRYLAEALIREISTARELAELIAENLKIEEWPVFLSQLSNESLFRIMLKMDIDKIQNNGKKTQYEDDLFNIAFQQLKIVLNREVRFSNHFMLGKAYIACLLEIYFRIRSRGPEFNSTLGQFGANMSYYLPTYFQKINPMNVPNRNEKLIACRILMDVNLHCNENLDAYLKNQISNENLSPSIMMALEGDTLSLIKKLMEKLFETKKINSLKLAY